MKFDIKEEDMIIKPYKHDEGIYVRPSARVLREAA